MSNIEKLRLVEVGENHRFDGDQILEAAKGNNFDRLVIIGELPDGKLYASGTANQGESLILIERAKKLIVFGEDD